MAGRYPDSVRYIQPELETVFYKLKKWLNADAEAVLDEYLPRFGIDPVVPPAFVLFSARLFGSAERAVLPALFLVFIHLATTLHDPPQRIQGRDRQLVVLEGDYIYAHLYFFLCQNDCLYLLERLSRLIREMNEGSVMRQFYDQRGLPQNDSGLVEILEKQYGLFFAECCDLGGLFAGSPQDKALLLRRFGHEFGIAYGFKEAGLGAGAYRPFLERALNYLDGLESAGGKDELSEFVRELLVSSAGNRFRTAQN